MLTFNSSNSKFTIQLAGDTAVSPYAGAMFARSKTMLRLQRLDVETMSIFAVFVTGSGETMYYSDTDGVLEVPLRDDIASAIKNGLPGVIVRVRLYDLTTTLLDDWTDNFAVYDGISYADALAPTEKNVSEWASALRKSVILPPNVMLNPAKGVGIIAESNFGTSGTLNDRVWSEVGGGVSSTITPIGARNSGIPILPSSDELVIAEQVGFPPLTHKWRLDKPDDCADLVLCRWTSLTGTVRQHYLPIVSYVNGTDKSVSLVTVGDGYDVRRNAYKSIRCRLTGLTAYGVWYYSDILQANDLHAIVNLTGNLEDEMASVQTCAFADADGMETPEGNGFFSFEIEIKMRHYDTI